MPASYVHQCVAKDAIKQDDLLENIKKEITDFNKAAYLAGAEGPDPLFFTLVSAKNKQAPPEVGHLIHERNTGEFIRTLLTLSRGNRLLEAYVMGFVSHYAADTIFHPYIYFHSNLPDGSCSSNKHCKFEHVLDVYMYRSRGNLEGLPVQMRGFKELGPLDKSEIAELLAKAIEQVFPDHSLTRQEVRKSFDDAVFLCDLLRKKGQKKSSVLLKTAMKTKAGPLADSHLMPNESWDKLKAGAYRTKYYSWDTIGNNEHFKWFSKWEKDIERRDSVLDLYKAAVERSARFAEAALDYYRDEERLEESMEILGNLSFDSGLEL